ncbi:MAG: thioredoxin domain-containing protein [Tissierellia bacterium]|nr:thioredoxin domain-containing protein [Tissierellia bacterium]
MRVYPTGTVKYNPQKCYNGINLVSTSKDGALITDMNGVELKRFLFNPMPAKMFPNGNIMGINAFRSSDFGVSDGLKLVEITKQGQVVWSFDQFKYMQDRGYRPKWMARAHSDYQREGNPTGYYIPGEKTVKEPHTLLLVHDTVVVPSISDKELLDDVILEVDYDGNILWKFSFSEHFEEFGFSEESKNVIYRNPNLRNTDKPLGNYLDITSISLLGENKWYDQGDFRFHPDNIIFTARQANIIGIIDKKSSSIIHKMGPDFKDFEKTGPIIGSAHAHLIPKGLPGEGNLLIFDNGGMCGYGAPNGLSPTGLSPYVRPFSRILEIHPITMDILWSIDPRDFGYSLPINGYKFYSPYAGNLQRLPNGNTLITMATDGMVLEVTQEKEVVWQWINPYKTDRENLLWNHLVYASYRYPYEYLDYQEGKEISVIGEENCNFRLPHAAAFGSKEVISVENASISEDIDVITMESELNREVQFKKEIIRRNQSVIKYINQNNFTEKIRSCQKAIVIFGAKRCLHCPPLMELLTTLLETEFQEVHGFYMDVDLNKAFAKEHEINTLPQTVFYRQGKKVYSFVGEDSYDSIADHIDKYLLEKNEK